MDNLCVGGEVRRDCSLLMLCCAQLAIGTVHLESLDNYRMRVKQLELTWGVLDGSGAVHAALVGDFNFSDGWKDEKALSSTFVDVWTTVHPLEAPETSYATPPPCIASQGEQIWALVNALS